MAERGQAARIGRPRYSHEMTGSAQRLVTEELKRQGYPGWRAVDAALPDIPTRLVQSCVRNEKLAKRRRLREVRAEQRIGTKVLAREAIWTMDGTQLERATDGTPVEAQVIKDRGSLAYRATRTGPPASSDDVIRLFDHVKQTNPLPLVCATDNGSIYCSELAQKYFVQEKIIHLRSLPRTPEHNGAVENSIRALKQAAEATGKPIEHVAETINENRRFESKGFKSPSRLDEELVVAYNKVNRDEFYEKCQRRLCSVSRTTLTKSQKRRAEREVIFRTLEEYGLIERTRGNRPYRCKDVEVFL
jgi:transposase InsO family protein